MSNQFPPSPGGDQYSGGPQTPGQEPHGHTPQWPVGRQPQGYDGYQSQNAQGQSPQGQDFRGYPGQNPQSQNGQGQGYGEASRPGYGQSGYGQAQGHGTYGQQQSYGQPGNQSAGVYAQGTYNAAPNTGGQGGGGLKAFPLWGWIVVGVVVLALIVGLIWGAIALFSGGKNYSLESEQVVDDVEIEYLGDWEDMGYGSYLNDAETCGYSAEFSAYGFDDIDADDVDGSIDEAFDDMMADAGDDIEAERLSNLTVTDVNGQDIEFAVFQASSDSEWGMNSAVFAVHPFSDSGDALTMAITCTDEEISFDDLKTHIDETEFELIVPEED